MHAHALTSIRYGRLQTYDEGVGIVEAEPPPPVRPQEVNRKFCSNNESLELKCKRSVPWCRARPLHHATTGTGGDFPAAGPVSGS